MKITFFVLHGNLVHGSGVKRPGELVDLDYFEAKYLVEQKLIKRHEPLIDKLATYADDPTQDSKGRKFPTIEEFKAAGFDPSTYDAFVAFRKKEADDAMGIKPLDDSKPASGKVDDTKAEAPGGSKGDGSAFVSKEKPEASPKAK